jgi:putative glutamine amidotransferase
MLVNRFVLLVDTLVACRTTALSPQGVQAKMSKPIIALNADYRVAAGDKPAVSYVPAGYYDALVEAGALPVILPPVDLLVGGADLDPRRDGWMLHPAVRPLASRRENFDRMLARTVCERRMPVFGIGVGMQLLNVTMGGNLFLHLPEDLPEALPHHDILDPAHRHTLELAAGSIMDRVYGDGELRVNSRHHMAIDELADSFRVTAKCPDGVIEAIESNSEDWFAMGTQFHPEAETASALDLRIFEEFLAGVKESAEPMRLVA